MTAAYISRLAVSLILVTDELKSVEHDGRQVELVRHLLGTDAQGGKLGTENQTLCKVH